MISAGLTDRGANGRPIRQVRRLWLRRVSYAAKAEVAKKGQQPFHGPQTGSGLRGLGGGCRKASLSDIRLDIVFQFQKFYCSINHHCEDTAVEFNDATNQLWMLLQV